MARKILLALLVAALVLLVVVPVGAYFWLRTSLPQTSGTVRVAGLDGTIEIVRDRWGVPHIFAGTDHDAFFGLGYVHAQDRLWQMEMNRRIGAGRLSEILGEATLPIDKFQRTMGYYRAAQGDFAALSERSQQVLQAYADGVNQWLGEGHTLPPEFLLLGVKPAPWTPYDSLVWEKMMSWDLGGDYKLELLRARLVQALGPERASQLLPDYPADGVNILSQAPGGPALAAAISPALSASLFAIDRALEHDFGRGGREVGSNDWVIGGDAHRHRAAAAGRRPPPGHLHPVRLVPGRAPGRSPPRHRLHLPRRADRRHRPQRRHCLGRHERRPRRAGPLRRARQPRQPEPVRSRRAMGGHDRRGGTHRRQGRGRAHPLGRAQHPPRPAHQRRGGDHRARRHALDRAGGGRHDDGRLPRHQLRRQLGGVRRRVGALRHPQPELRLCGRAGQHRLLRPRPHPPPRRRAQRHAARAGVGQPGRVAGLHPLRRASPRL